MDANDRARERRRSRCRRPPLAICRHHLTHLFRFFPQFCRPTISPYPSVHPSQNSPRALSTCALIAGSATTSFGDLPLDLDPAYLWPYTFPSFSGLCVLPLLFFLGCDIDIWVWESSRKSSSLLDPAPRWPGAILWHEMRTIGRDGRRGGIRLVERTI